MTTTSPRPRLSPGLVRMAVPVLLITLAVQLDATMTGVAVKALLGEFGGTLSAIQWVGTAYLLAFCVAIPATGWAADRFGAKAVWLTAIGLFLAGSVACGAAWSAGALIAFRAAQGLGGGMLIPLSQAMLVQRARPEELGRLMGLVALPSLLGPVFGPLVGGLLVDGASWRWIFSVNVPICVAAFALSLRYLPANTRRPGGAPLDVLGVVLLSPGLALFAYGLSRAGDHGSFTAPEVLWPAALGVVLLAAFAGHALTTRREPILDLRLLRSRPFAASAGTLLVAGMLMFGVGLLMPLYYQQTRGFGAAHAGLLVGPSGLGMALALLLAGRLLDRIAPRTIVAGGLVLCAAGALALTGLTASSNLVWVSAALLVSGLGTGAVLVPTMSTAYQDLDPAQAPRATSAIRTFMQLGGPFGLALFAVLLQGNLAADPVGGYGTTFWLALAITAVCVVPAAFLPRRRLAGRE
ncbi:MAG: hypothetical protein QOI78_7252 [Actinomycetota bacterium]|nr:hypothetical protein [Actinomycetota bacterium]